MKSFLFIILLAVFASEPPKDFEQANADFIRDLQEYYTKVSTIQAEFHQQKVSALFTETLVCRGLFLYSRPDKVRWEQKSPTPNYFILNGNTFIQFDGKEVSKSANGNAQSAMLKKFILGTIDGSLLQDKSFTKTLKDEGASMLVQLVPNDKRMKKRVQMISLQFNKKSKLLQELKIVESEIEYTQITFTKQLVNKPIATEKFN